MVRATAAGLGQEFLEAFEKVFDGLRQFPTRHAIVYGEDIRRGLPHRFPYSISTESVLIAWKYCRCITAIEIRPGGNLALNESGRILSSPALSGKRDQCRDPSCRAALRSTSWVRLRISMATGVTRGSRAIRMPARCRSVRTAQRSSPESSSWLSPISQRAWV